MPWHTVQQGEWVAKIAKTYRIPDWQKVYNHPENAELRRLRPDPAILLPGDRVFIPGPEIKEVDAATGKAHKFVLKEPKQKLKLVVKDDRDRPIASKPYKLTIDGQVHQGTSDGQGTVEEDIPLTASEGKLEIDGREFGLKLGHLNPIEEISGLQARLANLGYDCGETDGELNEETRAAIMRFQQEVGLSPTGEPDQATRDKLKEKHGC